MGVAKDNRLRDLQQIEAVLSQTRYRSMAESSQPSIKWTATD